MIKVHLKEIQCWADLRACSSLKIVYLGQNKIYVCFWLHAEKIRVGWSEKYFILFFHFILKWCKMQKCGLYLSYSYTKT